MRPAIASRWITALVEPPIAALTRIAFSKASGQDLRHAQVLVDHLDDAPAGELASTLRRESTAGMAAFSAATCPAPRPC
jgi:hypothetical protein